MDVLFWAWTVFAALVSLPALYLFWLTLGSRRLPGPTHDSDVRRETLRFDVIVPAHNEAAGITQTVRSLSALDYPASLRRIVVVADNCTDNTAELARAAGAHVLERQDSQNRGKGYALAYAFGRSQRERVDAVVVVDADSIASPNLLRAFASRIEAGAHAVQAHYGVSNPDASWRTRLMAIAFGMFHILRSLARERLKVSCGLRGNGMCFTRELIEAVPHDAFSVVEDLEYGIRIGRVGHRVVYAHEAYVLGEMVSSEAASRSQRRRWEGGRWEIARKHGLKLLVDGVLRRSLLLLDLAADVWVPPLSWVAATAVLGAAVSWAMGPVARGGLWVFAAACFFVGAYVLRGWVLSGVGRKGLWALAWAPVYVAWKLALMVLPASAKRGEWVRTARERR